MKKGQFLLLVLCLLSGANSSAQRVLFPDDEKERGYHQRPYLRYEAEPGRCQSDSLFLEPTYDQRQLQSEASHQTAVQLTEKNAYVQWTNEQTANGLTLRFSLPDATEGTGTQGLLALYVDGAYRQTLVLDSYWAWQYFLKTMSNPYPDNLPNDAAKFPRMRFDEIHILLDSPITAGSVFRLMKADDNDRPCTIDFVELEPVPDPVTFESIRDENKVAYDRSMSLPVFINQHGGQTIYLPAGRYEVDRRILLNREGTALVGAGMWHTEIYFTASSDDRSTYGNRGIEATVDRITLDGLFLNTINNKRYYNNDDRYQVGKALMGSFGASSVIRNVWAEHFECGAWIDGTDRLTLSGCRFRNHYADGINLSYGSTNSVVEHCSFRNNGDDDMATWSRDSRMCENNMFRYCTAENNWRASSLGFFGGKENRAHHCLIIDPLEAGFRLTCDFPGAAFSDEGYSELYDISVYRGGAGRGNSGIDGDLWGNRQGALHINSSTHYDLQRIRIHDIDFYDSKDDAVFIGSAGRSIHRLILQSLRIDGTGRYGIYYNNPRGDGHYCNIEYHRIAAATPTNPLPAAFLFDEDCSVAISMPETENMQVITDNGRLLIVGPESSSISVYDTRGRQYPTRSIARRTTLVPAPPSGIYLVSRPKNPALKIFLP